MTNPDRAYKITLPGCTGFTTPKKWTVGTILAHIESLESMGASGVTLNDGTRIERV